METTNPLENILQDLPGVPSDASLYHLPLENIQLYFNKVAKDDVVYARFMDSMRMLRMPIKSCSNQDVVKQLCDSLESGQPWKVIAEHFRRVLYFASDMDMTIPMLQRRSFRL